MLTERDSFFHKVNIHIIQCDDQVQTDVKITCAEELVSYMLYAPYKSFSRYASIVSLISCFALLIFMTRCRRM